ncbi:MAG: EAL domain-containing protein [Pseudomonadota bacterium]
MFIELIKSVALLLALSYLQNLNSQKWDKNSVIWQINTGLLFGLITIIAMMIPIELVPGLIFDPRSVIISLVAYFYGGIATLISVLLTIGFRAYIGGTGVYTGILVILVCAIIGLVFKRYENKLNITTPYIRFFCLGIIVHLSAIFCFLTLAADIRWIAIESIAIPFMLILPPATMFLGALLLDIDKRTEIHKSLNENEKNYRNLFEKASASLWLEDFSQLIIKINNLQALGIKDYHEYFKNNPDFVKQAIDSIQVINVNQATIDLYEANNKSELLNSLDKTFTSESYKIFVEELIAIAEGKNYFRAEAITQTLQGKKIHILLTINFPEQVELWDKIIISMMDITEQKHIENSLRYSEHKHREVVETSVDGFWIVSTKGKLLDVNAAYIEVSGYSRKELLGMHVSDLEVLESNADLTSHINRIIQSGSDVFQTRQRKKNGLIWPVEITATYSELDGGCLFVFLRDIYHRKMSEYLIKLRQQLADITFEGSIPDIMTTALNYAEEISGSTLGFFHFVEDEQQTLNLQVWSNNTLKKMHQSQAEGTCFAVKDAGIWADCIHKRLAIIHNDYASLPHKKGLSAEQSILVRELTVPIFRHGKVVAIIGVGNKPVEYTQQDISTVQQVADIAYDYVERRKADEHIEYLAYYDVLTGLCNRTMMFAHINQAITQSKRNNECFALCFLDLDGFKPINDRYGHAIGDKLLIAIALIFRQAIREGDSLSRIGGDEFVILLTQLPKPDDYQSIVKRILDLVASPVQIDDIKVQVTASIGITFYPQDNSDPDALLRHADQAMYKAKSAGKNRFYIHNLAYEQQLLENQRIVKQIKKGLEQEEFVLYYQPKVNMFTGEIIGLEALIRWIHPERGLLLPGLFLPYIDGKIEEIVLGEWVIKNALIQLAQWQSQGIAIPVSVNVSAQQLQHTDLAAYIKSLLKDYPKKMASYLELEVLETAEIQDISTVSKLMQKCSDLGIKFALDDFGTGYSSLAYFHSLPIDILKIDQHFVRDMLDDPNDLKIVRGIINLAAQYQRPVIAEGVESIEIAALLMNMGNTLMQGYVISKPIPDSDISQWIEDWEKNGIWQELKKITFSKNQDIILQVAFLSFQRWIEQFITYISTDAISSLPELSPSKCAFYQWYKGIGRVNYANHPSYPDIGKKHNKIHQLADQLHLNKDDSEQKKQLLQKLYHEREEFILMLSLLTDTHNS